MKLKNHYLIDIVFLTHCTKENGTFVTQRKLKKRPGIYFPLELKTLVNDVSKPTTCLKQRSTG